MLLTWSLQWSPAGRPVAAPRQIPRGRGHGRASAGGRRGSSPPGWWRWGWWRPSDGPCLETGSGSEQRLVAVGTGRAAAAATPARPTCDVVVSSPGAVDVEVSEEEAAAGTKGRQPAKLRMGGGGLMTYLNCSSAQKMPLFLPMVLSVELMVSTLPCAVHRTAAQTASARLNNQHFTLFVACRRCERNWKTN